MNKKAFVLSIVLWIVATLLLGLTYIIVFSKDNVKLTSKLDNKLKTTIEANNILEILKFHLVTSNWDKNYLEINNIDNLEYSFPQKLFLDGRWYEINKNSKIQIINTSALLNPMYINSDTLSKYLSEDRKLRQIIRDSITDWKDEDNVVSLNGAEQSRYTRWGKKFKLRNNPDIQFLDELRLINGIDKISEETISKKFSELYIGLPSPINLSLVNAHYLAIIFDLSESYAKSLIDIRNDDLIEYENIVRKLENYDDTYMGFVLSKQAKIRIESKLDDTKTVLEVLIDYKQTPNKLFTIIDYDKN